MTRMKGAGSGSKEIPPRASQPSRAEMGRQGRGAYEPKGLANIGLSDAFPNPAQGRPMTGSEVETLEEFTRKVRTDANQRQCQVPAWRSEYQ